MTEEAGAEILGGVLVGTTAIETLSAGPASCRACGGHSYSRCVAHGGVVVES